MPNWSRDLALAALDIAEASYSLLHVSVMGYAFGRSISLNPLNPLKHKTRFHEMAHVILGHTEEVMVDGDELTMSVAEAEAESVAYLLCSVLDLPGQSESRYYIVRAANFERRAEAVRAANFERRAEAIRAVAPAPRAVVLAVDRHGASSMLELPGQVADFLSCTTSAYSRPASQQRLFALSWRVHSSMTAALFNSAGRGTRRTLPTKRFTSSGFSSSIQADSVSLPG